MIRRRARLKKPMELGQVFINQKASSKLSGLVPLYRVQKYWEQMVGKQVAERCYPVRMEKNRLIVKVENPSWTMHLGFIKEDILEKVLEYTQMKFSDVQFETGKVRRPVFPVASSTQPTSYVKKSEKKFTSNESLDDIMARVKQKMSAFSSKPTA